MFDVLGRDETEGESRQTIVAANVGYSGSCAVSSDVLGLFL